jgi:hypothetical protein
VLFVRWDGATESADFDRLVEEVRTSRARVGRDLVYVAIIPRSNRLPESGTRSRITTAIDQVWTHCASIHIVIEGEGMRRALVRSVIAGILLVVMRRRRRFTVHLTVEEALREATEHSAFDLDAVLSHANRLGLTGEDGTPSTGTDE